MSLLLQSDVWESETLSTDEKLVLLWLADGADDRGHYLVRPINILCNRTSMSETAASKVIEGLFEKGVLAEVSKARNGYAAEWAIDLNANGHAEGGR